MRPCRTRAKIPAGQKKNESSWDGKCGPLPQCNLQRSVKEQLWREGLEFCATAPYDWYETIYKNPLDIFFDCQVKRTFAQSNLPLSWSLIKEMLWQRLVVLRGAGSRFWWGIAVLGEDRHLIISSWICTFWLIWLTAAKFVFKPGKRSKTWSS